MKRKGNIYAAVYDLENLFWAERIARAGKTKTQGVRNFDKDPEGNLAAIREMLIRKTYTIPEYRTFDVFEPKKREISCLDYFPHAIIQHAIIAQIEGLLVAGLTTNTYSCIRGRGIRGASEALKKALRDPEATRYCLKIDVRQFYPTVDHDILKQFIRRKIKDNDMLWLLDLFIDSATGLPIGNYLSAFFANLYLNGLDHEIKQALGVKHYFRYLDDMVILGPDKPFLHGVLAAIRSYLTEKLNLTLKQNYQVFPVAERGKGRGIDFVGFVHYHTHTRLRKTIKKNYAREMAGRKRPEVIAGFKGWAKQCDARHLEKKLHHEFI